MDEVSKAEDGKRSYRSRKDVDVVAMLEMRLGGARVEDICSALGISAGTYYRRFGAALAAGDPLAARVKGAMPPSPLSRRVIYEAVHPETGETVSGSSLYLARRFGINFDTLKYRLASGMGIQEALTKPVQERPVFEATDPETGEAISGSMRYLARRFGVNEATVRSRMRDGMTLQEALAKPVRRKAYSKRKKT